MRYLIVLLLISACGQTPIEHNEKDIDSKELNTQKLQESPEKEDIIKDASIVLNGVYRSHELYAIEGPGPDDYKDGNAHMEIEIYSFNSKDYLVQKYVSMDSDGCGILQTIDSVEILKTKQISPKIYIIEAEKLFCQYSDEGCEGAFSKSFLNNERLEILVNKTLSNSVTFEIKQDNSENCYDSWSYKNLTFYKILPNQLDSDKIQNHSELIVNNAQKKETSISPKRTPTSNDFILTVNGRKIEVYKYDLDKNSFRNANVILDKMGQGWRLPDMDELKSMYWSLFEQRKGSFKKYGIYWSKEKKYKLDPVWCYEFAPKFGPRSMRLPDHEYYYIRPVRDIN